MQVAFIIKNIAGIRVQTRFPGSKSSLLIVDAFATPYLMCPCKLLQRVVPQVPISEL